MRRRSGTRVPRQTPHGVRMGTFKENAVNELLTVLPSDGRDKLAFLCAAAKQSGSINIRGKRSNLVFALSSYEECLALVGVLKSLYPTEFEISAEHVKSGAKKGTPNYTVAVPSGFTKQVLFDVQLVGDGDTEFDDPVPSFVKENRSAAVAYLKGLFLVCGSVYVPSAGGEEEKREGYHFEFMVEDGEYAGEVCALLSALGIAAKTSERGSSYLVYIKDRDEILSMLAVLGLADSALKLKAIINERETANALNRAIICETANLDKTYAAASRQLMDIGIIEETVGLDSLSPALRETARARMEYQQASLNELAEILGVTKSCLNHRLRKLAQIAAERDDGAE